MNAHYRYLILPVTLLALGCWDPAEVALNDDSDSDTDADTDTDSDTDSDTDTDTDSNTDSESDTNVAIVDIQASATCSERGNEVSLSAITTGAIDSWAWTFGDSGTSTAASPDHFYTSTGRFTVSLTISGPQGSDTLEIPDFIRIIDPGWERVFPGNDAGTIQDIQQAPSYSDSALAVGRYALLRWYSDEWQSHTSPDIRYYDMVATVDPWYALVAGVDQDHIPRVYYFTDQGSDTTLENTDPTDVLPHSNNDNIVGLFMDYYQTGYAAIQVSGGLVELFRYNRNNDPAWTAIISSGNPNWIDEMEMYRNGGGNQFFALVSNTIYRSNAIYDAQDLTWISASTGAGSPRTLAVDTDILHWIGGYNGLLQRLTWQDGLMTYASEDFTAQDGLWETNASVVDLAFNSDHSTLYALIVDSTYSPARSTIVQIDNPSDATPAFSLVPLDDLSTGYTGHLSAYGGNGYGDDVLWYASNSGMIARWDGTAWEYTSGSDSAGSMRMMNLTPDNRLLVPISSCYPQELRIYDANNGTPTTIPMPNDAPEPQVAWALSEADDIMVLTESDDAYFWNGTDWRTESTGLGLVQYSSFNDILGFSLTDVWAIGESDNTPVMARFNGTGWVRDAEAEALFDETPFVMVATDADNIYTAASSGALLHWDGSSWDLALPDLFTWPSDFGRCVATSPASCTGTGYGITPFMAMAPDGILYATAATGTYTVLDGSDGNCPAGEFRCVIEFENDILSTEVLRFDGSDWSVITLPELHDGWTTYVLGLFAPASDYLYASLVAGDVTTSDGEFIANVYVYDGTGWTPLTEDLPTDYFPFLIEGQGIGDFWSMGIEGSGLYHYQSCVD